MEEQKEVERGLIGPLRYTENQKRATYLQLIAEAEKAATLTVTGEKKGPRKAGVEGEADTQDEALPLPDVLRPYQGVFQEPILAETAETGVKHRLRLREPIDPIRKVLYRLSPVQREVLTKELLQFRERG